MIDTKNSFLRVACLLLVLSFLSFGGISYALELPDKLKIISLLKQKKYVELESLLEKYQKTYEKDYQNEFNLELAYWSFYTSDPSLESYLKEWIKQYPNSYSARLARGVYYTKMGWVKRGKKFIGKTPPEQIYKMEKAFSEAKTDLEAALKINPGAIVSYFYLIDIEKALGDKESNKLLLNRALKTNPYSFSARRIYIQSLVPKWGGSFEEMQGFVNETDNYVSKNPKLRILRGYIEATNADIANRNNDRAGAIEYYTKAISFGDYYYFFRERGEIYAEMGQSEKAMSDLNKALDLHPQNADTLRSRGRLFQKLGKLDLALSDLNLTIQLDPLDPHNLSARAHLYKKLKRYKDALEDYKDALINAPNDAKIWRDKGILLVREFKDYKNAKHDLELATILDPNDADAWYFHGFTLYHMQDNNCADSFKKYLRLSKNNSKRDEGKIAWVEKYLGCDKNPSVCK